MATNDAHAIDGRPVIRITLGSDGRIYCHDIPVEMMQILRDICPLDVELRNRIPAVQSLKVKTP